MGKIRIGTSGWNYPEWRGRFYPPSVRRGEELAYLATHFPTVEVNGSFYRLTRPDACRRWYRTTPREFRFAVKGSRYITHLKRLRDIEVPLANFFASGLLELGDKLGPVLWQLPGNFRYDADTIEAFLGLLPAHTEDAAAIARRHDDRVREPAVRPRSKRRIRHVLEFRHPSFFHEDMARMARRHGVSIAISHTPKWPLVEEMTAGIAYVRLHGPGELYASSYGEDDLRHWASRVGAWHQGGEPADAKRISSLQPPKRKERDVWVFFDNDLAGRAPEEAARLQELVQDGGDPRLRRREARTRSR